MEPDATTLAYLGRLVLAVVLGGLVGLDRETTGKPAGFRTNILICVGSALLMEVSIEMARMFPGRTGLPYAGDPGRIAAQVVSGIGFLGAGTIIQSRHGVRGLTTAATIWVVAAIGLATGAGHYFVAISTTLIVLVTLRLLDRVAAWLDARGMASRWIRFHMSGSPGLDPLRERLRDKGARIESMDIERLHDGLIASFRVVARADRWDGIVDAALSDPDVRRASLE
jgi:putative Mg2+ transporter-C (MgtC) family protein